VRLGAARLGADADEAWLGLAVPGDAGLGWARFGLVRMRHGTAWRGKVRLGLVGSGLVGLGFGSYPSPRSCRVVRSSHSHQPSCLPTCSAIRTPCTTLAGATAKIHAISDKESSQPLRSRYAALHLATFGCENLTRHMFGIDKSSEPV
jgi:hypothetical protein